MAQSKRSKLNQLINQRSRLRIQLASLLGKRAAFHRPNDGSLHFYYSQKNPKHNLTRSNMDAQIRNIERKLKGYDVKINGIKNELNN